MSSSVLLGFPRKVLLRARADCSDLPVGGTEPESDGDAGGHGALRGLLGGSYSLKISHQETPLPVDRFSPDKPGLETTSSFSEVCGLAHLSVLL